MIHAAILAMTLAAAGTAPALGQQSLQPGAARAPQASAAKAPKPRPPVNAPSRAASALAASAEPTFDDSTYLRLKDALLFYSDIMIRGGWPSLPADAKLAPGATGPAVALLRQRLVVTEDLPPGKERGETYDADVIEGVKRFQLRHGLDATGSVGPQTLKALNVPVRKRMQQMEASIERLAGMDFSFGRRYVVVNIPAAYAEAVNGDKVERRHTVIVGKTDKQSPTLTTSITSVVLNPTWTVPLSITKNEIIPKMRKDPGYLARMRMRVLDGRDREMDAKAIDWSSDRSPNFYVRQDSGPGNALGFVKIDMPNPHSVYMHDTDRRNLFANDYRFLSHGCARVENVRDLAVWLLQDTPGWSRATVDDTIAAGNRKDVPLARKVPVAWVYLTAWMMRDGTVQFRDDVYLQDTAPESAAAEMSALQSAPRTGTTTTGSTRPTSIRDLIQASGIDSR
jgi:murein L,D-transpeptidase YcbB/YkuD